MSATTEDLIKFLRGLRQVREYTTESISEDIVNDMLEVGLWSGTSGNKQLTEVIVVRDRGVLEKLGGWGTKPAATSAVSFVICSKNERIGMDEGRLGERLMLAARAHGLGAAFDGDDPLELQGIVRHRLPVAVRILQILRIANRASDAHCRAHLWPRQMRDQL